MTHPKSEISLGLKLAFPLLILFLALTGASAETVRNSRFGDAPEVTAKSVCVIDANTGKVLLEKSATAPRHVASTQKLLVALLILEQGELDKKITIAPSDTQVIGARLGLKAGHDYSRRQLLMTLLVRSANDVAIALARDHSGSADAFVEAMNARAKELGAENTVFKNPHGLTVEGQHSTARDIARIARAAYQLPEVQNFARVKSLTFVHPDGSKTKLENTNTLLDKLIISNGLKTGTTRAAGHCLVASAASGDQDVIAVVLGSTNADLDNDAAKLLVWAVDGLGGPVPPADYKTAGIPAPQKRAAAQ